MITPKQQPSKPVNRGLSLAPEFWQLASDIGYGNIARGVRIALIEYKNTHDVKPFVEPKLED